MALNAGCSGMATLHANSAADAIEKLVGYCVLAADNVAIPFVRRPSRPLSTSSCSSSAGVAIDGSRRSSN